jgi:RNA polymerase sigma-70 factor (ECF subfamily)
MVQAVPTPEDPQLRERFERDVLPMPPVPVRRRDAADPNPSDAEDLIQETYLRAYRGSPDSRRGPT